MVKLALFSVSYAGIWYRGKMLSLKEQISKAKEFGFEGFSIEAKRPVGSPLDLNKKDRREIKEFADSEGIELCAVESMSNFVSPITEERENNLAMVKDILEMANDMEVNLVKVFPAWPGVSIEDGVGSYLKGKKFFDQFIAPDTPYLKYWNWAVEGIREVAGWAKEYGQTIAVQNHPPVVRPGYEDILSMVNEVGMNNVKLCLDAPLFFDKQSDEYIKEAVESCKDLIVHSHYPSHFFREIETGEVVQPLEDLGSIPAGERGDVLAGVPMPGAINFETFVRELKRINFDGYLVSEQCGPTIKEHKIAGIEEVDRAVKAGLKYMRTLIAKL